MPARLISALALLLTGTVLAADQPVPTRYELRVISKLDMTVGGRMLPVTADTTVRYTWAAAGAKRVLTLDGIAAEARQGDTVRVKSVMNADEFVHRERGEAVEFRAAEAPPEVKAVLADTFGPPLYTLTVDAAGRETARERTARPGAADLVGDEMVANATLFHPPFPAGGANPWTAPRAVGMGDGGVASGELTYTPQPGGGPGETVVKVAGTLAKDRHEDGPKVVRNARYVVSGTQTYSAARGGWVSGKLVMEVTFDIDVSGKSVGTGKGTMTVTLTTR